MENFSENITRIDKKSFEYLFDTYYRGLCAYSLRYVRNHDAAEDIVQEVFYTLWTRREELNFTKSYKSYLFSSVKNRCLDAIKHAHIVDLHTKEKLAAGEVSENFTWDRFVEKEIESFLAQSLQKLPDNLREVFILNKVEGMTAAKIAEQKGISQRTIEGQISKAISLLKEHVGFLKLIYILFLLRIFQ